MAILVNIGESAVVTATFGAGVFSAANIDTTSLSNDDSKLVCASTQGNSPDVFSSITVNLDNTTSALPPTTYAVSGMVTNANEWSGESVIGNMVVWAKNASTGAIIGIQTVPAVSAGSYPVAYSIDGLPDSASYEVGAFIDKNGNGTFDAIEGNAQYESAIDVNGSNVTGCDIDMDHGYVSASITNPANGSNLSGTVTFSGTYVGYPEAIGFVLGEGAPTIATFSGGTWSSQIDTSTLTNDPLKTLMMVPGPNGEDMYFYYYNVSNPGAPAAASVSGTISIQAGHTPNAGILRIWCQNADTSLMYSQQSYTVTSASFPRTYSITGIPLGQNIQIVAFIDENNNNSFYDDHFGASFTETFSGDVSNADLVLNEY